MSTSKETRERTLRKRAEALGLRVHRRGNGFELRDNDSLVLSGALSDVEGYVGDRYERRNPGPMAWATPPAVWARAIDDYLATLVAAGQTAATIKHRRQQLGQMARELDGALADVTGEQLVAWLGSHTEWSIEHRRSNRSAARLFFLWAYKTGRIPVHIADELPKIRQLKAAARPAPDHVWRQAIAAADPRTALILRLAAEAGLRRAEISQLHLRDLTDSFDGQQLLLVHGKGGKKRTIPISDSIAALIRSGAGLTAGASSTGWVFPNGNGGHLDPGYTAELAQRVLSDGWTLHTLRHRFATRAYRGERNLRAVQVLLGHSSIATTERYLAVDDDEVRAAMLSASEKVAELAPSKRIPETAWPSAAAQAADTLSAAPDELAMPHREATFESVISGWDDVPRCEVDAMVTHEGGPCKRRANWRLNLHGCLQILMCGHDIQAWKRRQLAAISRSGGIWCVHCGQTFTLLDDCCSITRL